MIFTFKLVDPLDPFMLPKGKREYANGRQEMFVVKINLCMHAQVQVDVVK